MDDAAMWDFERVLAWLREVAYPCAPPIGVGEFEVLYASGVEVVVWYSPAREGHRAGEVAIPCRRLAAAWEALCAGHTLDEAALTALGEGVGGGRWLLALLALLPGAQVEAEPLRLEIQSPRPRAPRARRARGRQATVRTGDEGAGVRAGVSAQPTAPRRGRRGADARAADAQAAIERSIAPRPDWRDAQAPLVAHPRHRRAGRPRHDATPERQE
jgi:hypothetical protein